MSGASERANGRASGPVYATRRFHKMLFSTLGTLVDRLVGLFQRRRVAPVARVCHHHHHLRLIGILLLLFLLLFLRLHRWLLGGLLRWLLGGLLRRRLAVANIGIWTKRKKQKTNMRQKSTLQCRERGMVRHWVPESILSVNGGRSTKHHCVAVHQTNQSEVFFSNMV